ncbi:MAG: lamin tail domain-containing protein [Desulfobacterales bacterium]|nr:lamin tail domain-containing protein [Desulfobacterales bacterium]
MSDSTTSDDLANSASLILKSRRYTAFYDANDNGEIDAPSEFTSIDHVLLSPNLKAQAESAEIPHNHDPRFVTDHFPVVVRLRTQDGGVPTPALSVKIESLLPNPVGNENQNEEAAIINLGTQPVSLIDWKLRDLAGKTWALDSLGTLNVQERKSIKRNGQPMALNNNGDTIALIDSSGNVVHAMTYSSAEEGAVITPVID